MLEIHYILPTLAAGVEWLKRRVCNQHDLGSKPTRAIQLRP